MTVQSKKEHRESDLTRTQQIRREDILRAAIIVINRDGYASTSLGRIATEAGTSKGTVLYHFKSKQAINEALIDSIYEEGAAHMRPRIDNIDGCLETLKTYLTENLRFVAAHVAHVAAVHQILQDVTPRDYNAEPIRWLVSLFEKGQESGELGTFDPSIMAAMIRAVIDSSSFHIVANPSLDMDIVVQEVVRVFDKAVRPE